MVALANKDFKKAVVETKKVTKHFKNESLGLLLKSETLKIEKKYDELSDVYEAMLKNTHTNLLGLTRTNGAKFTRTRFSSCVYLW